MNELARHLTHEGSHGDLPFHPSCPTCREERLSGLMPVRPLVPARAQAGLAAAVLAGSAVVPAVAAATTPVPEEETSAEGTQDPGDGTPPDIDGTDPGSGGVNTPVGDQPAAGVSPTDGDDDSLPPGADVAPQGPDAVGAPPIAAPPQPATPAPGAPAAAPQPAPEIRVADKPAKTRSPAKRREAASTPQVAPAPEVPAVSQRPVAPIPAQAPPADGGRYHVVQDGESLWTIARERLGARATPAEIAREVKRIWDLNADAIGTGDPDLVMAGQRLRLR